MTLEEEADRIGQLLAGKVVARAFRPTAEQVVIEFTDGSRFFANPYGEGIDVSITFGSPPDDEA
jgi:hypothetical protein